MMRPDPARTLAHLFLAITTATVGATQTDPPDPSDPSQGEVALPCADGWDARLVFDAGVGVWTVGCCQVQPWFGAPEIVALDDRGRCTVLRSYSGKWTPQPTIEDGSWFAPFACTDIDTAWDGVELYVGGAGGRLWQLRPRRSAHFDARVIGEWPGEEVHSLVADDLDPASEGTEMLVFLKSGRVHLVRDRERTIDVTEIEPMPGRVRQAVVLPEPTGGDSPWIATVSRVGELTLLRLRGTTFERKVLTDEPVGMGRIAVRRDADGTTCLYVTRDDGVVLRFAGSVARGFTRELVFIGPQGPRGLVTGRFHEDPNRECLALFGYSKDVELLTREPGGAWESEVIFTDADKGHWLTVGEIDGRNATDEIIGSGYGGRVFSLARPPGYGMRGVAVHEESADTPERPIRLAMRARDGSATRLTPLRYTGGFETKSMIYETLVRRDDEGRIVPGLASSWAIEDDGRAVRFTLREGARFHDGTRVTADAVRLHFRRWVGLPEHDWLPSNRRIRDVEVLSDREFRVGLTERWALLPDLCAINPCAIQAPGSLDTEGEFARPIGSGPFRFVSAEASGSRWRVARVDGPPGDVIEILALPRRDDTHVFQALARGEIDALIGGWDEDFPTERLADLERDPAIRVLTAPGSSVVALEFRLDRGITADLAIRSRIANAISRSELIRVAEGGRAEPCTTWAAPSIPWWPEGSNSARDAAAAATARDSAASTLLVGHGRSDRAKRVSDVVARQLRRAGFDVERRPDREADVYVSVSHGVPYDPHTTLVRRFGSGARGYAPDALRKLVDEAAATPDEAERVEVYARIQTAMDRGVLRVPLYSPHHIALHRADVRGIDIGTDLYHATLRPRRD